MEQKKVFPPSKLPILLPNGRELNMKYLFDNGEAESNTLLDSLLRDIKQRGIQRFQEYSQLCSLLYEFSPANQLLLAYQIKNRNFPVKFLASRSRWEAIGLQLHGKPYRTGTLERLGFKAKAFFVWVPKRETNKKGEEELSFRLGQIYGDCAILQGPDPQKDDLYYVHPPLPKLGNSSALEHEKALEFFLCIVSWARGQGWSIEMRPLFEKAWQPSGSMMLHINSTYDPHVHIISLLHALIWYQLVGMMQRAQEFLMQTSLLCAYIIGQAFGIEHDLSQQAMEEWAESLAERSSKDSTKEREELRADLGMIQRTVKEWILRIRSLMGMPNLIVTH